MKTAIIEKLDYHRNGISGEGFHVAIIDCPEGGRMVAIRFPDTETSNIQCAVLNIDMLAAGNIEFGAGNSWRGDHYAPIIDAGIKE